MKKIIALVLVLTLALFAFASCGNKDKGNNNDNNTPTEKTYTLSIGVAVSTEEATVDNTVAVIVTDADGKIVLCRLDAISLAAEIANGEVVAKTYSSKAELGKDYGMLTNSPYYGSSLAEWDDQAKAFESYVVGKTASDVSSIVVDADGKPTDAALTAGCTMGVSDFITAINNAFSNNYKVTFKTSATFTAATSVNASVSSEEGTVSYDADFAGVVVANGTVISAIIDSTSVSAPIENDTVGAMTYAGSKLAQGDKYGMLTNSPYYGSSLAEWYSQAQAYANTAIGKTVADLNGLATEGVAGCTMYSGGYKAVLVEAASNAR